MTVTYKRLAHIVSRKLLGAQAVELANDELYYILWLTGKCFSAVHRQRPDAEWTEKPLSLRTLLAPLTISDFRAYGLLSEDTSDAVGLDIGIPVHEFHRDWSWPIGEIKRARLAKLRSGGQVIALVTHAMQDDASAFQKEFTVGANTGLVFLRPGRDVSVQHSDGLRSPTDITQSDAVRLGLTTAKKYQSAVTEDLSLETAFAMAAENLAARMNNDER